MPVMERRLSSVSIRNDVSLSGVDFEAADEEERVFDSVPATDEDFVLVFNLEMDETTIVPPEEGGFIRSRPRDFSLVRRPGAPRRGALEIPKAPGEGGGEARRNSKFTKTEQGNTAGDFAPTITR